jgi:hypothetical protein
MTFADNAPDETRPVCPACGRPNAPNRTACLYCGGGLPIVDASVQRPAFRQLEEWEAGYNLIHFPREGALVQLEAAADWLKTSPVELGRTLDAGLPLPLARVASEDEAVLVCEAMQSFGLDARFIPDRDLALQTHPPKRIRALAGDATHLSVEPIGGAVPFSVAWEDIVLFVPGRLLTKRVDTEERAKGRKDEQEVVAASETGHDELVLDIYAQDLAHSCRIHTGGFDFSCLREAKELLATNNFNRLCEELRDSAPEAAWQLDYEKIRPLLSPVWPMTGQTDSKGWQRTRGSSLTRQMTTTSSNENQFTRFSRLCYHIANSEA